MLVPLIVAAVVVIDSGVPSVTASATSERPTIDGRLGDAVWAAAERAAGFRQVEPRDGAEPGQRTDVMVAYDGDALYVAARLYDDDPAGIVARLGRRDAATSSDLFRVDIDSYHDHRTAFRFTVNPAGVRTDGIAANDDPTTDDSWDPVWDVATHVDEQGWTVEMRIPFSQLRFSGARVQEWGVNFERYIQRTGELDRWRWVPSSETGHASHFGHLVGLRDLGSARANRLEVLPYVVAQGDFDSAADPSNPFNDGRTGKASVGGDIKYGLSSGLTLSGTVNPDFGQVEADPAEVNLTVYETYFNERRPFFVEGANLFNFGSGSSGAIFGAPTLFYSRRIGRPPSGGVPDDVVFADVPEVTRILGAAKLSGQVGGWSIGVLDALVARENARVVMPSRVRSDIEVEPRTNVGVLSLRRDFRGGRSGIGLFGTSLTRSIDDPALEFLRSSAHAGGLDFFHRFAGNQYSVSGTVSGSLVRGEPQAIAITQRSSARYYQRPDQDYLHYDPERTSLSGYALSLSGGKTAGRWTVVTDAFAYSPGFEINDAGFQQSVDRIFHGVRVRHRWLQPTRWFRSSQAGVSASQQWNYGGTRVARYMFADVYGQLHNYWAVSVDGNIRRPTYNDRVTRGGPLVLVPREWSLNGSVSSDPRKSASGTLSGSVTRNRSGGYLNAVSLDLSVRPSSALEIAIAPALSVSHSAAGYVTTSVDPTATEMYGRRYIVSDLTQRTMDITLRTDWALTSRLSFQGYAQPFTSSVDYAGFKAFARPRAFAFLRYGVDGLSTLDYDAETATYTADADGDGPAPAAVFGNPDFSLRSLRANLVLRWEYRAGSTLYVAWAHGRGTVTDDPRFHAIESLGDLLHDDQRNRVLVKLSYWFNP